MDHATAAKLVKCLMELNGPLNQATELSMRLPDIEEQRRIRSGLSGAMSEIYKVIEIVSRQHPDLDPIAK